MTLGRTVTGTVPGIQDTGGNAPIPRDGLVLSARGAAGRALLEKTRPGDRLRLVMRLGPRDLPAIWMLISGSSHLVSGGTAFSASWITSAAPDKRHPRTVLAFRGREAFPITVDGRQEGWSVGMTFLELADFLVDTVNTLRVD